MTRLGWLALALLGVSVTAGRAAAQAPRDTVDRWSIGSELGLNAARGNSSYTMLSTGLRVTHLNRKQFELDWSAALTYGESNGTVIARRMSTAIKGDYRPKEVWSPFLFASIERDRIRRIDALTNGGVGAKWTFLRGAAGSASVSAAALYAYKDIVDDTTQLAWRLSVRPRITHKAGEWSFEQTTFYQPEIGRAGDFNVDASTRVGYSPSKLSTLFVQHTYRVDSRPPAGIKREDQLMVAGIKLSF